MEQYTTKTCSRCKQSKPLDAFSKGPRYADGRQSYCRSCMTEYRAEKFSNPENRITERRRLREYYRENDEARERNRSAGRKRDIHKWHNDLEYRRKKNIQSSIKNQKRRKYATERGQYSYQEWVDLCARYDHRCLCCGKAERLTPDHVIPLSQGGMNTIENIQPLCLPCNLRKGIKTIDYRPTY